MVILHSQPPELTKWAMAVSSNYIFTPTKFNFRKVGRVTASILAFLRKIGFEKKSEIKFRMFSVKGGGCRWYGVAKVLIRKAGWSFYRGKFRDCWKWGNLWIICELLVIGMLVFAGVQKILFQITRERLMCTLKTWIYLWPCSTGTGQLAGKSSSSTRRSMSRGSLRRKMESCCKSRIIDGQRFITTAGFDEDNMGGEVQLNMRTPWCRTSRGSQTGPY